MLIRWERKLLVNYPLIDDEHRMLLWLCRKVQFATSNDMSMTAVRCACLELEAYAQFHLTSEDNLMHEVGYPGAHQHSLVHQQLLVALRRMTKDLVHRKLSDISIAEFLTRWLVYHIEHHDRYLSEYLSSCVDRPIAEKYYAQFLKEGSV